MDTLNSGFQFDLIFYAVFWVSVVIGVLILNFRLTVKKDRRKFYLFFNILLSVFVVLFTLLPNNDRVPSGSMGFYPTSNLILAVGVASLFLIFNSVWFLGVLVRLLRRRNSVN